MRNKLLLLLFLCISHGLTQEVSLDPFMLSHVIYGEQYVKIASNAKTTNEGILGTSGYLQLGYQDSINCETRADSLGSISTATVMSNYNLTYRAGSPGPLKFVAPATGINAEPYASGKPLFPSDLSFISPGTVSYNSNATLTPGKYNELKLDADVIKLEAGTYHFHTITMINKAEIIILPDSDGNYKTEIYVLDTFLPDNGNEVKISPDAGVDQAGKVLILYAGTKDVQLGNKGLMIATLMAPNAKVIVNNQFTLPGQVLADKVELGYGFGGDGGIIFKPLIKSNIHITPPDFLYEDTVYKAIENSDSNSYATPLICSLSTVIPTTAPNDSWVRFKYAFIDSTAEYGKDYSTMNQSGTVTFNKGDAPGKIIDSIFITDDSEDEVEEYFNVIFFDAEKSSNLTGYEINLGADTLFHTIRIIDDDPTNNDPTDISLSNLSFKENNKIGDTLGVLSTEDLDQGDTHTYSIVGGSGDFAIAVGDSVITIAKSFDYEVESPTTYTLKIKSSDGFAEITKDFTVTLLPLNDNAITDGNDEYTVDENKDTLLDVLSNSSDLDLPADKNVHTIIGFLNGAKGAPTSTSKLGATLNISTAGNQVDYIGSSIPPSNEATLDEFWYIVKDSANYTGYETVVFYDTVYVKINRNDVNDLAANVSPVSIIVYENSTKTLDLSTIISDGDNSFNELTVSSTNGAFGTTVINGSILTYTSVQTGTIEEATDEFTVTADDLVNGANSAKVTVTILPVNDNASVATVNSYTIEEKETLNGNVYSDGTSDSDADKPTADNKYKVELVGAAPGAAVQFSIGESGAFTYENDGTPGTYTFKYSLRDSSTSYGNSFDKTLTSNEATVTITVNPSNSNDPVAGDSTLTDKLDENTSLAINVSSLVSDADFSKAGLTEKLTFTIINTPTAIGEAVYSGDSVITYTHGLGDVKTEKHFVDTIKYEISDAANQKDTGTIIIPIQEKNDNAPVQADTTITVVFGKGNKITLPTPTDLDLPLGANNPLIDKSVGIDGVISVPTEGTVTIDPSNKLTFIYTPTFSSSAATDEFTYQIIDTVDYDKALVQFDTAKVIINLDQSSKNKPIARDTTFTINEGGSLPVFNLSAICTTGASGGSLTTYNEGASKPDFASSYSLNSNGDLVYVHNDSENFVDIITYSVNDNGGNTSAEGIITINIIPLNDNKPVLKVDTIFIAEGDQNASINILANDTDPDTVTSLTAITIDAADSAKFGNSVVSADGTVIYNHDGTENELLDSFVVKVSDTASLNTAIADYSAGTANVEDHKVFVVITPVNDNTPEASSKTYSVDEGGTLTVSDSSAGVLSDAKDDDLDNLSGSVILYPTLDVDSLFVFNTNGTFTYVHNGSELFIDSFTVKISDGELDTVITVVIDVNPINDEAAVGVADSFAVNEGSTLDSVVSFDLILDADEHDTIPAPYGNFFILHLQSTTVHGDLSLDTTDGTFIYKNNGNGEFVADSFTYTIEDSATYDKVNSHMSEPITVYIKIVDQNDETPVSQRDSINVDEGDTAVTLFNGETSVLWNDTDADVNSDLKAFLVDSANHGTVVFDSTGFFSYAHDSSATVLDSFTYRATDGVNVGSVTTVMIGINPKAPYTTELFYIDGDANGQADTVFASFNENIDVNDIIFSLMWSDDSSNISIAEVEPGKDAQSAIIVLENAALYKTSGTMLLTATYKNFDNETAQSVVSDKAAPVVKSAVYVAKGSKASLTVELSEPWYSKTKTFTKPFIHISDGKSTVLDFGEAEANGATYRYDINISDMTLGNVDSLYINIEDSVSDIESNEQLNSMNIRQPILSTNSIKSATYLDTNYMKDGKVDIISFEMTLPFNEEEETGILEIIKKNSDKLLFNTLRDFEYDTSSFTLNSGNFEIAVTEKAVDINTAITDEDIVTVTSAIPVGANSIDKGVIEIVDSVAPVPVSAKFAQIDSATFQLTVEFSETVNEYLIVNNTGTKTQGFVFTDVSSEKEFSMDLEPSSVSGNTVTYTATNISIDYVVTGDLLRVETTVDIVSDTLNNVQKLSVDIPITVQIDYGIELELYITPQPFELIENETEKKEAKALPEHMVNHYSLLESEKSGVAFIIEATGPLSPNMEAHEGNAQLFDNTGNAITDVMPMRFGTKSSGNTYGIVVWDGTNTYGRAVARGALLLTVEVTVLTDEGPESRKISQNYIKAVGIRYSK